MRAKDFLREFAPEGYEQYTVYIGHPGHMEIYARFSHLDDAIEEAQDSIGASEDLAMMHWEIRDAHNRLIWDHNPDNIHDNPQQSRKTQFRKPGGLSEQHDDDLGNIYALHPDPVKGESLALKITDVNLDEFDDRWAKLPLAYINEFGGDLPLWDTDDLKLYPNMKIKRVTFDQYIQLLTNYIRSEDITKSTIARARNGLSESTFKDHEEQFRHFTKWAKQKLNITKPLPKIRFQDAKEGDEQDRTGYYDSTTDTVWIYTGNRNLVDILRTLCHELVHCKQHEHVEPKAGESYPFAPKEVEADAIAGSMIKMYLKEFPGSIE